MFDFPWVKRDSEVLQQCCIKVHLTGTHSRHVRANWLSWVDDDGSIRQG